MFMHGCKKLCTIGGRCREAELEGKDDQLIVPTLARREITIKIPAKKDTLSDIIIHTRFVCAVDNARAQRGCSHFSEDRTITGADIGMIDMSQR